MYSVKIDEIYKYRVFQLKWYPVGGDITVMHPVGGASRKILLFTRRNVHISWCFNFFWEFQTPGQTDFVAKLDKEHDAVVYFVRSHQEMPEF